MWKLLSLLKGMKRAFSLYRSVVWFAYIEYFYVFLELSAS